MRATGGFIQRLWRSGKFIDKSGLLVLNKPISVKLYLFNSLIMQ
jgi:hypothetical protein